MGSDGRAERFLKACRREPVDCTPVWLMRQAGRYMAEYRALREKHSFLELARTPELVTEVTLQPVRAFEVDAAILFADIALPLAGLGVDFRLEDNVGPVIDPPLRTESQILRLRRFEASRDTPYVLEGVRQTRRALEGKVPLIGFSGAPFTLASYMVEGRGKRDFRWTKGLMYGRPDLWDRLMGLLAEMVIDYLGAQVDAGVQAVQIFDSWVGILSPDDYEAYVAQHSQRILRALSNRGVPVVHFGTDTATLLPAMARAGGDVIGVDWRVGLDAAWEEIGPGRAIQGNLDPCTLLADFEVVREQAGRVLQRAGGRRGHIFNLGHGILPGTPVDNVHRLVDYVHATTAH